VSTRASTFFSSRPVRIGGTLLIMVGLYQFVGRAQLAGSGADVAALRQILACPKARTLLGNDIDYTWWGVSFGNVRKPHRDEWKPGVTRIVHWRLPVVGTNGSGVINFEGVLRGNAWELDGALEVGDTQIRTRRCEVISGS
jgi:hypothetical protein